jgi:glycosyltransferase involved in cell wall biosynthesis
MDERDGVRITFVIPFFYPAWQYGGQPRSAFELARGLVRRGHSVEVLTTDSGGESRLAERSQTTNVDGIEVSYYSNISNYLAYRHRIVWSFDFFREIRERIAGTDVLHIHELRSTTSVLAYREAQRAGVPYVLSAHGGLQHLGKRALKVAFDSLWGKRMMSEATAFFAVSPVEESDALDFGVKAERIHRLANAINLEDFGTLPGPDVFRSRRHIGSGTIILFLGRLHWIKGADVLVDAFKKVHDREPAAHLVIAGPDDGQQPELRRRLQALRLDKSVTFTGFLDDTQKLEALTGSDVVVVPSRHEVFALTAIESLLCGTPVILSSACGLHPLPSIEQGVIPFESQNPNDLADKVLVMAGPQRFRHNVAAGREFVIREFSSDSVAAKAERIYQEILQVHGKDGKDSRNHSTNS